MREPGAQVLTDILALDDAVLDRTSKTLAGLLLVAVVASAIEQAMEAVPGSELERAREIWQRKFGSVAASQQERLKQMRFLASRGFSSAVVHQVVRGNPDE